MQKRTYSSSIALPNSLKTLIRITDPEFIIITPGLNFKLRNTQKQGQRLLRSQGRFQLFLLIMKSSLLTSLQQKGMMKNKECSVQCEVSW